MNWEFLKTALKSLLPIILILIFVSSIGARVADYNFHFTNMGEQDYPPLTAYTLNTLSQFIPRTSAIILLNLLLNVILPYMLLCAITKNELVGWVYLYGSGIAFITFFGWFIPQGFIHVLILLSILHPAGLGLFALIGGLAHREWLAGFLLALGYILYTRYKHEIFTKVVQFGLWPFGKP